MRRAVFFDRDGTICRDLVYLSDPDRLELLPGVADALWRLQAAEYLLIIATNQSGIARGYLSEDTLARIHNRLHDLLGNHGIRITAIYHCPHLPDGGLPKYRQSCSCRKPEPGMLLQAAREHGIDLTRSFMIGDKLSDIQAGRRAGCRSLWLQPEPTVAPLDHSMPDGPDAVVADLTAAVDWILGTEAT